MNINIKDEMNKTDTSKLVHGGSAIQTQISSNIEEVGKLKSEVNEKFNTMDKLLSDVVENEKSTTKNLYELVSLVSDINNAGKSRFLLLFNKIESCIKSSLKYFTIIIILEAIDLLLHILNFII